MRGSYLFRRIPPAPLCSPFATLLQPNAASGDGARRHSMALGGTTTSFTTRSPRQRPSARDDGPAELLALPLRLAGTYAGCGSGTRIGSGPTHGVRSRCRSRRLTGRKMSRLTCDGDARRLIHRWGGRRLRIVGRCSGSVRRPDCAAGGRREVVPRDLLWPAERGGRPWPHSATSVSWARRCV